MPEMSLAQAFVEAADTLPEGSNMTWDDFFDVNGVPIEERSDFLIGSILKQAKDIIKEGENK